MPSHRYADTAIVVIVLCCHVVDERAVVVADHIFGASGSVVLALLSRASRSLLGRRKRDTSSGGVGFGTSDFLV